MASISDIKNLIEDSQTVVIFKHGCPFCKASTTLLDKLNEDGVISDYTVYYSGEDISNEDLTELVKEYGWEPDGTQLVASKPQIFIKGQYVGGNFEFYKSEWNLGEGKPNLENPMRF